MKIYFAQQGTHFRRISAKVYERIGVVPFSHAGEEFKNNKFILKGSDQGVQICHINMEDVRSIIFTEFTDILNKCQKAWPDIAKSVLKELFVDNLFGPPILLPEENEPKKELIHILWKQDFIRDKQLVAVFKNKADVEEAISSLRKNEPDSYYYYSSELLFSKDRPSGSFP